MARHISGCYYNIRTDWSYRRHYLPQVQTVSHTTINPLSFTTNLSQTFVNPGDDDIPEVRYTFPLYDGVVVTSFSCTVGDKVITGHVEQKEQARLTYDAAVKRGESAALLESLPLAIFGVTLGNVAAKATIKVDMVYGGELKHDAQIDGLRYTLPTSIAPRFGAYPGELLQPDTAIPRSIQIIVDVDMCESSIRKVQSPSKEHPISVSLGCLSSDSDSQATFNPSKACVTLAHETSELGEDFILQLLIDNIASPKAVLEKHSVLANRQALLTTFVPKFNLKPARPEIVFIADQSGSMSGSNNAALIAALKTFLKSLPVGVRFNICPFGSTHNFLWEKSMPYNRDTAAEALDFVQRFNACHGGTEMYHPIRATFEKRLKDLPLDIILLTDGQVTNERQIFNYINDQIQQEKVDARCFVLGVGGGVSHTLVEGVARAGNGVGQFITTGEVMDQKVVRMLKAALYPHINHYTLDLEYEKSSEEFEMVDATVLTPASSTPTMADQKPISLFDTSADLDVAPNKDNDTVDRYAHLPSVSVPEVIQAPHIIPSLLPFNRTTIYLILNDEDRLPASVVLHASSPEGPLELRIPINTVPDQSDNVINALAAKKACQDLEEGRGWLMDAKDGDASIKDKHASRYDEIVEREIVRLGVEYQVANKHCSFVAVEKGEQIDQSMGDGHGPASGFRFSHSQTQSHRKFKRGASSSTPLPRPDHDMGFMPDDEEKFDRMSSGSFGALKSQVASMTAHEWTRGSFGGTVDSLQQTGQRSADRMGQQQQLSLRRCRVARHSGPQLFGAGAILDSLKVIEPLTADAEIPISSTLATIRALIDLQNFDGSWEWSQKLEKFFHLNLEAESHGHLNIQELVIASSDSAVLENKGMTVVATALVLEWMELNAAAEKDIWDMVADKGRDYIEEKLLRSSEMIMQKAKELLSRATS